MGVDLEQFVLVQNLSWEHAREDESAGPEWALVERIFVGMGAQKEVAVDGIAHRFDWALAAAAVTALGTVIAAWIQGGSNRKVKIKTGDVEVEANNKEEALDILAAVRKTQNRNGSSVDKNATQPIGEK